MPNWTSKSVVSTFPAGSAKFDQIAPWFESAQWLISQPLRARFAPFLKLLKCLKSRLGWPCVQRSSRRDLAVRFLVGQGPGSLVGDTDSVVCQVFHPPHCAGGLMTPDDGGIDED